MVETLKPQNMGSYSDMILFVIIFTAVCVSEYFSFTTNLDHIDKTDEDMPQTNRGISSMICGQKP